MDEIKIKKAVRKNYGEIARSESGCGCGSSCCQGTKTSALDASRVLGYSDEQMSSVPESANLGLGCGNPTALGELLPGETVLDLGSGAGFDSFLAANIVGETGKVIGVDMTHEMVKKARDNATRSGKTNVEFRLGEIEHLPVTDNTIDVIISNCVINLVPNKQAVFREAWRVLKPGGRIMISDVVLTSPTPEGLRDNLQALVGCVSGAILLDDYLSFMKQAGFNGIEVIEQSGDQTSVWAKSYMDKETLAVLGLTEDKALTFAESVISASIKGIKQAE